MRYNACVIGCGRIGFGFDKDPKRKYVSTHTAAYSSVREVQLVAVCDLDKNKVRECCARWKIPHGYLDMVEMLKEERIDILSICTPPQTHYAILKRAVDFPLRAIFCEKPLADNLKDAKEMVELCKKKKIILQIDHQRRFDPLHIKLREAILNKKFGAVQQANFYYTAGIKNTGSHMFDILRFFFGEAEWLKAIFSKNKSHKENDPNLDGIIKFSNGLLVTFQSCDVKKYLIFEMDCFLEQARFVIKDSGLSLDFYKAKKSRNFSGYNELYRLRPPFSTRYKRNSLVNAVRHIIKCLWEEKEPISSGIDGLKAMELILAGIESAENSGRRVYL